MAMFVLIAGPSAQGKQAMHFFLNVTTLPKVVHDVVQAQGAGIILYYIILLNLLNLLNLKIKKKKKAGWHPLG